MLFSLCEENSWRWEGGVVLNGDSSQMLSHLLLLQNGSLEEA